MVSTGAENRWVKRMSLDMQRRYFNWLADARIPAYMASADVAWAFYAGWQHGYEKGHKAALQEGGPIDSS